MAKIVAKELEHVAIEVMNSPRTQRIIEEIQAPDYYYYYYYYYY